MTRPVVTGVIIYLNAERFIGDAIESVLRQTYRSWELVLVDDGSTDKSTDIVRAYANRYGDRIRWIDHDGHKNLGMSASRNRGIKEAHGRYIAFLDADDIWTSSKLADQVQVMEEHPEVAMCFGRTLVWNSWVAPPFGGDPDWFLEPGGESDLVVQPPTLLKRLLDDEWTCPCTCSLLVRRTVCEEVGGFEEQFRGQLEDMVFHTKVFLTRPVFVSSACWGWYRQHSANSGKAAMATGEWLPHKPNPAREKYLRWVKSYLTGRNHYRGELRETLDRELRAYQKGQNVPDTRHG